MGLINKFRKEYGFLSNMRDCKIHIYKHLFDNAEAAFQSQKNPKHAHLYVSLSGLDAKKLGKQIPLRRDWSEVKDSVMKEVTMAKYMQNEDLREKLLNTENHIILEGNTWHDNYWGSCTCWKCGNKGENKLGRILMETRAEIRIIIQEGS